MQVLTGIFLVITGMAFLVLAHMADALYIETRDSAYIIAESIGVVFFVASLLLAWPLLSLWS